MPETTYILAVLAITFSITFALRAVTIAVHLPCVGRTLLHPWNSRLCQTGQHSVSQEYSVGLARSELATR